MSGIVAIVGRPNVGKSTLFNRLVGFNKAIVDDVPGVTRDRNYADIRLGEKTATLVDTGGFDADEKDGLMARVRDQTMAALEEADLIVFLADGKQGLNPHDRDLLEILRRSGRPFIMAVNKIDGPEKEDELTDFYELGIDEILPLSAAHGYGIGAFRETLAEMLPDFEEAPVADNRIRLAVIGRPNVGKSSLINQLVGSQRALVTDIPGTTRDPVDISITRGDREYTFVDTAGIRRKGKVSYKLEKFAVMRALRSLERSDVALLLIDSLEGVTDQDVHVAGYAVQRGRGLILVFNKWDLIKDKNAAQKSIRDFFDLKMRFLSFAPYVTVSAKTGLRVDRIFPLIDEVFTQYKTRVATAEVNRVLTQAVEKHTPPYVGRRRLKFYYAAQTGVMPPTFVLFANKPEKVHFSYERYLSNCFRESFGLDKIPIRIIIRPKDKKK